MIFVNFQIIDGQDSPFDWNLCHFFCYCFRMIIPGILVSDNLSVNSRRMMLRLGQTLHKVDGNKSIIIMMTKYSWNRYDSVQIDTLIHPIKGLFYDLCPWLLPSEGFKCDYILFLGFHFIWFNYTFYYSLYLCCFIQQSLSYSHSYYSLWLIDQISLMKFPSLMTFAFTNNLQ